METKQIALASFVGAYLGAAVTILVAPTFWKLGILAGFAGGYLSYEYRKVIHDIPTAISRAWKEVSRDLSATWAGIFEIIIKDIGRWFSRDHPILYPATVFGCIAYFWPARANHFFLVEARGGPMLAVLANMAVLGGMVFFSYHILSSFVFIGSRIGERCYYYPFSMRGPHDDSCHLSLEEQGYTHAEFTYENVAKWATKGVLIALKFLLVMMWWYTIKYTVIGLWKAISFLFGILGHLFKLIHSEKRLLCGVDSAIGVAIFHKWLGPMAHGLPSIMLLVLFGGLIGAALGVFNWQVVSIRLLHVDRRTT